MTTKSLTDQAQEANDLKLTAAVKTVTAGIHEVVNDMHRIEAMLKPATARERMTSDQRKALSNYEHQKLLHDKESEGLA